MNLLRPPPGGRPLRAAVITTSTPGDQRRLRRVVGGGQRHAADGELRLARPDLRHGVAAEQQHRRLALGERGGAVLVPLGERVGLGVLVELRRARSAVLRQPSANVVSSAKRCSKKLVRLQLRRQRGQRRLRGPGVGEHPVERRDAGGLELLAPRRSARRTSWAPRRRASRTAPRCRAARSRWPRTARRSPRPARRCRARR